jgi:hypothetical protein
MAITGQGQASKEQVAVCYSACYTSTKITCPDFMDATDALGAAYCHFLQLSRPDSVGTPLRQLERLRQENSTRVATPKKKRPHTAGRRPVAAGAGIYGAPSPSSTMQQIIHIENGVTRMPEWRMADL